MALSPELVRARQLKRLRWVRPARQGALLAKGSPRGPVPLPIKFSFL